MLQLVVDRDVQRLPHVYKIYGTTRLQWWDEASALIGNVLHRMTTTKNKLSDTDTYTILSLAAIIHMLIPMLNPSLTSVRTLSSTRSQCIGDRHIVSSRESCEVCTSMIAGLVCVVVNCGLIFETKNGIKPMKATLLNALHTRFDGIESNRLYSMATLLDARFKQRFLTEAACTEA